jgi:hypothetical protein
MTSANPVPPSSSQTPDAPEAPAASEASAPASRRRARRSADLFDVEGNPVHINLTCLCCKAVKPLAAFGLRKMPNGIVRNQPWCRSCRSSKSAAAKAAAGASSAGVSAPAASPAPAGRPVLSEEGS